MQTWDADDWSETQAGRMMWLLSYWTTSQTPPWKRHEKGPWRRPF